MMTRARAFGSRKFPNDIWKKSTAQMCQVHLLSHYLYRSTCTESGTDTSTPSRLDRPPRVSTVPVSDQARLSPTDARQDNSRGSFVLKSDSYRETNAYNSAPLKDKNR